MSSGHASRGWRAAISQPERYGLVLILIVIDYVAQAILSTSAWGRVVLLLLFGLTLVFTLWTSRVRRVWLLFTLAFLAIGLLVGVASLIRGVYPALSASSGFLGGMVLFVALAAILHRILQHSVVTSETILGAVSVYLLIGISFASVYSALARLGGSDFFVGVPQASSTDYLFFSFTTLTTVGYGNLVPAGSIGQTMAMLEALMGQIYLVVVVARLVSVWSTRRHRESQSPPPSDH